jgi:hypothetical protein
LCGVTPTEEPQGIHFALKHLYCKETSNFSLNPGKNEKRKK